MIWSQYLPQTANCQHMIQKVMSCCLRSFVVTKTYSIKQLYPQPQKCLSQFGAEMYWQNNRKKLILQPDMFYLCSSQKLCALWALHLAHFWGSTNRPWTNHSTQLSIVKKNRPEIMFQPWDLLSWLYSC